MRVVLLMAAVLTMGPGITLAQEPTLELRPSAGAHLRVLPAIPTRIAASPPPEIVPPGPMHAGSGMTLAELEAIALANSPSLRQSSARVEEARGRWTQAGLRPNPVIGYQGNEIGNEGRAGQQGGFLGQEFVMGGKLQLSRAAANQEIVRAEQELAAQRFRVLNDVRIGFYTVLIASQRVDLTRELLATANETFRVAEQMVTAGELSRGHLLHAHIDLQRARILAETARNHYLTAWRRLAAAVAVPDMVPLPLVGDLQSCWHDLTWEAELGRLLNESPQLAAARAAVARASWALRRARAEPIPNLDLQAGLAYDNASRDTISNVQLGVSVPLYNRNQGNIYAAEAELAAAQAELRRLELQLQDRLAVAFEGYANARYRVQGYVQSILPDAKRLVDLGEELLRAQEVSGIDVKIARRNLAQSRLLYVEALRDLYENQVAIEGLLLFENREPSDRGPVEEILRERPFDVPIYRSAQ